MRIKTLIMILLQNVFSEIQIFQVEHEKTFGENKTNFVTKILASKQLLHLHSTADKYLTIIPWARVGYEMIDSQRGA